MANLDSMRKELERKARAAAREAARQTERALKRRAPFQTGELRDSIRVTSKPTTTGTEIDVQVAAPHAWRMRREFEEEVREIPDRLQRAWRGTR